MSLVDVELLEDDWMFESVRLYKTLQMYDLQIVPKHLTQCDLNHLLIAGEHPVKKKSEILLLKLPSKLLVRSEQQGLCKGNDFEITAGAFFDGSVTALETLKDEGISIAAFQDAYGLSFLKHGESSVIVEENKLVPDLFAPTFCVDQKWKRLMSGQTNVNPLVMTDIATGDVIYSSTIPTLAEERHGHLSPRVCHDGGAYAVLHCTTGAAVLLDTRTSKTIPLLHTCELDSVEYDIATDSKNSVGILSSTGKISIIDTRSPDKPYINYDLPLQASQYCKTKLQFGSQNRVSISGFDSTVGIFKIVASTLEPIFTHRGHSELESESVGCVNSHLWLPHVAENFLVSCADNGTVNCWEYKNIHPNVESL